MSQDALEAFRALRTDVEQFDDFPPHGDGSVFSQRVPAVMKTYLVNWLRRFVREHGDAVEAALKPERFGPQDMAGPGVDAWDKLQD